MMNTDSLHIDSSEFAARFAAEIDAGRVRLAELLRSAAERAKVDVNLDYLAEVSNGEFAATFTIVSNHRCNILGFLSLPGTSRLKVPPNFYLFDAVDLEPDAWEGTAVLRDLDGNVVLDDVGVRVEKSEADDPGRVGLSLDLSSTAFSAKRWKAQGSPGLHIFDVFTIRF